MTAMMLHGRPLTTPTRPLPPCYRHLTPPHRHLTPFHRHSTHLWCLLTPLSHSYRHPRQLLTPFCRLWRLSDDI